MRERKSLASSAITISARSPAKISLGICMLKRRPSNWRMLNKAATTVALNIQNAKP